MVLTNPALTLALATALASEPALASFPKGFKWCVATSAHQIEGGNAQSDWWEFEKLPGVIRDSTRSGEACDHWNQLQRDLKLLEELGVNQYRFSVEWARIEPAEGRFSKDALEHYRKEASLLRARGIEPLVTLHHFTLPLWVAQKGGFTWSGIATAFARYAEKVYEVLGDSVTDWITINEPQTLIGAGYIEGIFPPQKKDLAAIALPTAGMLRAHAAAFKAIHAQAAVQNRRVRVGLAHHLRVFEPARKWNPLDWWLTRAVDQLANWAFLEALRTGELRLSIPFTLDVREKIPEAAGTQDLLGINYYSRDLIAFSLSKPGFIDRRLKQGAPSSDLQWEIYPEGLGRLLRELGRRFPGKPISVTENGLADREDTQRVSFIQSHLQQVLAAIDAGVPVEGYCHWTLMDNYEWSEGFSPRFGLYSHDPVTHTIAPRPSALWFSKLTRSGSL
jgi:beta-glucosidase